MNYFKKRKEAKEKADEAKALDAEYKVLLYQTRIDNVKAGKDYENIPINKNLVSMSEIEKNEAEKKKAESQTQSKLVNGVQVGCTVFGTYATYKLWKKDTDEGNATRTEVGKTIANYGRNILNFFKRK